ncbi:MAG: hypothetical protein AAF517_02895 [Planctomycetota bacterium]
MKHLYLPLSFLLFAGTAGGQGPSFPDVSWKRLDPAAVKDHPGWEKYQDAFDGATDEWEKSPLNVAYGTARGSKTLGELVGELRDVRKVLSRSQSFESANDNGPRIHARLLAEFDRLLDAFDAHLAQHPDARADWASFRNHIRFHDFQVTDGTWDGSKIPGATKPVVSSNSILFASRDDPLVLGALQGEGPASLEPSVPFAYFATLPQAIEAQAVVRRLREIFADGYTAQISVAVDRLGDLNEGWDNYLSHGFSQYPWEALANSHLTSYSWSRPPKWQWVLAHPEVATVADIRRSGNASIETAVAVHGLGLVRYFGDERKWFLGASATVALTNDSDFGMGLGPTIHFGHASLRSRIPHLSVSLLWHDFEDGGDGPVLGVSVDLWKLLSDGGGGSEIFREALGR